ncbi:MAG: aminotransferase class I/II-fold pyridoxal phosphate-dependent enzyme [Anaerolineae bacterium]|nr:aminotransferase class I/II-fold pyridoxal phosphate-dependent enzyme [Anaerolineae bacterium]
MPPSWYSPSAAEFSARHAARFNALSLTELDAELHDLVAQHERHLDHDCINLYAGTNMLNPRAAKLLASSLGSRPSLGHPGDKYNKGMGFAEQIEVMEIELFKRVFNADYVEHRVGSGSLANLYVYMATTQPGDTIMAFADAAAGHPTHHAIGAAGLYGLNVVDVPFDTAQMDVDIAALRERAHQVRPRLIIVAGSMCLFPYSVRQVRAIADEIGAMVMYDAAHMGGMIAGGQFQQPLAEGAHVMTGSTYKSLGGPAAGFIATNDAGIAERLDRIAFPGLTANFDLSRSAAMCVALMDVLEHGAAYAQRCIENAQTLAQAMHTRGLTVHDVAGKGFTASQHVALQAIAYGGGNHASKRLEPANVLMTSISLPIPPVAGDANAIRIGTQEITRWGMMPEHMPVIANFIGRVLLDGESPAAVRDDVIAFRRGFQRLCFVK